MPTLENTDPTLHYDPLLKTSALAYADGLNLTDPPDFAPLWRLFQRLLPVADHGGHQVHFSFYQCEAVPGLGGGRPEDQAGCLRGHVACLPDVSDTGNRGIAEEDSSLSSQASWS